jgi:hypothetical protein
MNAKPCSVRVIVDPAYGERLRNLPADEPRWAVDSDINHPVIRALWREHAGMSGIDGVASFRHNPDAAPEDWLISMLRTIDLHHGEYSHNPPYSLLDVIGTPWSHRIQEELDELRFLEHEATAEGFVARRDVEQ